MAHAGSLFSLLSDELFELVANGVCNSGLVAWVVACEVWVFPLDLDLANGRRLSDGLLRTIVQQLFLVWGRLTVGVLPLGACIGSLLLLQLLQAVLVQDGSQGAGRARAHGRVGGIGIGRERGSSGRHGGGEGGAGDGRGRERYSCHVRMVRLCEHALEGEWFGKGGERAVGGDGLRWELQDGFEDKSIAKSSQSCSNLAWGVGGVGCVAGLLVLVVVVFR